MKARLAIVLFGVMFLVAAVNSWATIWSWFFIPHLAFGGGYTSYLTIRDPQGISTRSVWVYFYADDGSPLAANVEGQGQNISNFNFTLLTSQEKAFAITGPSGLKVGSISIAGEGIGTLDASLRFTTTDASGNATDVVGILPAAPNFSWTVAVEKRSSTDYTGFAIANPWNSPATVTLDFYQNGSRVPGTSSVAIPLNAVGHYSNFVHAVYPNAWGNFSGTGTLRISSQSNTFSVIALRGDGTQYSSLQADVGAQMWNWTYADTAGTQNGSWSWRFNDGYSFMGYEQNSFNADKVRLRGVLAVDITYFLAEWLYTNSDTTKGQIVFMGIPSREGSTDVINGTRIQLRSDGTILSNVTFKATRVF
jgi:hypothetical protein